MNAAILTRDLVLTHTRALKLPGIARVFESLARQARDAHWPHEDYLQEVLSAEQASRHESVIRQRLREAHLKKLITEEDLTRHVRLGDEVCRLLAGLARYLYKSNFKDRGHYKASLNDDDEPSRSIKGRRT